MKIFSLISVFTVLLFAVLVITSCDSGIGDDLRKSSDSTDCRQIQDYTFNVSDGDPVEWDAIDPDTIIDQTNDVTDPDLDIIYVNFVYSSSTPSIQFEVALRGVPNTSYDILISINNRSQLVITYNTVWEAELFEELTSRGLEIVTPTPYGFEGEITNYLMFDPGDKLSVVVSSRDATITEIDYTERRCIAIP